MDIIVEISVQFVFINSTKANECPPHRYVVQIIQIAEHAHFAELGHTGEESELDIPVHALHHPIERFQGVAVFVLQFVVIDGL